MNEYKIYCGGEFISSSDTLPVTNKYTGEVIAQTYLADTNILNKAINSAVLVKAACFHLSSFQKEKILLSITQKLENNINVISELLCMESGKPIRLATAEVKRSIQTFKIASEECKRIPHELLDLDWTENGKNKTGIVKHFPIGIVAGISPFNFPLNLAVHKIAPAIAAGCPIILKPASNTPLSTLFLAKLINETELPKGAVSIIPMNRITGSLLVDDERINLLSFTGSPEVGWDLKSKCGKKKVVLELGGNAGVIISQKVDVDAIINKCINGAFAYSGQICIHAQRFIVHESNYDAFILEMKKAAMNLKTGDPLNSETDLGPMIDETQAKRVELWVNESIKQGATLIYGGKRTNTFYEPTILTNTTIKMKVNAEEIFGPVICIEKYSGEIDEAIRQLNDTKFGLQCGIFTDSIEELEKVFKNALVGGVIHNDVPTLRFDHMPYGGIKESGLGREGVKYAMMDMLETKILVK
ncbi:MAG: aldehyde dehydrogenase family protein [Sphingobacteriaceae bacterium]|nr:aldehyde dehydrogenase family protein [Sphingobacteriaceae bacterium]